MTDAEVTAALQDSFWLAVDHLLMFHTNPWELDEALEAAGHRIAAKSIVTDDIYRIRAALSAWIADEVIDAVLITGGTGFSSRDSTPEAVRPLFDKDIDGFGELFRALSYQEIGSSTVQSRALAGFANDTVIFCVPGSTGACKDGWDQILIHQLDSTHKPCNLVELMPRLLEK